MKFNFAHTKTIDDYLPSIVGRDEFIVADRDWFQIINYMVNLSDSFADPEEPGISVEERTNRILRRDLRGIKFDKKGNILQKPYHKFFNVNEKGETQSNVIDWSKPHIILDKMDGSMISTIFSEEHNGFRLTTKMGITDTSMRAEVWMAQHPRYWKFLRWARDMGYSPIFEWTSDEDKIVLDYERNMTVTAMRELHTGRYMPFEEMERVVATFDIPLVGFKIASRSTDQFITEVAAMGGIEGFVVRFEDGHMIKIKCDEYVIRHRSKEISDSPRMIFNLLIEEKLDDLLPTLDLLSRQKVKEIENDFDVALKKISTTYFEAAAPYLNMAKKEFAMNHRGNLDKRVSSAIFSIMDGHKPIDLAHKTIASNLSTDTKFKSLRKEFNF